MMLVPIPFPDFASPTAVKRLGRIVTQFAASRLDGDDFYPTLITADRDTGVAVRFAFPEDPMSRAATVVYGAAWLGVRDAPVEVVLAVDSFVSTPKAEDFDDAPAPSEDPAAVEALMLVYAQRGEKPRVTHLPYHYGDDGTVVFDEGDFGWKEMVAPLTIAVHLAVDVPANMPEPPTPGELEDYGVYVVTDAATN